MKLNQIEYCHGCDKHVKFEFEDFVGKQIIICPNCKHQHFREIDEDTIVRVRMANTGGWREGDVIRTYKCPEISMVNFHSRGDNFMDEPIQYEIEEKKVLKVEGSDVIVGERTGSGKKFVTDRRWGKDPSQRG